MRRTCIPWAVAAGAAVLLAFGAALAPAQEDPARKGWGREDPYNKLYNPREIEKFKARVVRVFETVPMPGMSPATALEVREGNQTLVVHLCPVWFASPGQVGVRPGDAVSIRGAWAEIGGKDVFLAAKVKKGDTYEFKARLTRDGTPLWTLTPEELARERAKSDD